MGNISPLINYPTILMGIILPSRKYPTYLMDNISLSKKRELHEFDLIVCVSTKPFRVFQSSNNQIIVFSNCVNFS
jgi:hypothetical protein